MPRGDDETGRVTMRDGTSSSHLGHLAPRRIGRCRRALAVGALAAAGAALAACGPSDGSVTSPSGGESTNPSRTSSPSGPTGSTPPKTGTGPSSSVPTGSHDEALVGNWVEESSEMTGECEDIDSFSFGDNGSFTFAEDPENDNCAGVETYGQWATEAGTLALDTESSNCGQSCSAAYGTVDWSYQVTNLTLTLCTPGTTTGCVTYEADNSES